MPGQFLTRLPEIKPSPIVTMFDEHRQANSTPVRAAGFRMPVMAWLSRAHHRRLRSAKAEETQNRNYDDDGADKPNEIIHGNPLFELSNHLLVRS